MQNRFLITTLGKGSSMAQKIEKFDRYQKIAEALGSVGGVPVTGDDVRAEMRTKAYNTNIGGDGLLPRGEMARLAKNVRHAVAQKQVDEEEVSKLFQPRKQAEPVAAGHMTLDSWKRANRFDVAMASGLPGRSVKAQAAWAEYFRGPMWLR